MVLVKQAFVSLYEQLMEMLRRPESSGNDLINCALHSFNIDFKARAFSPFLPSLSTLRFSTLRFCAHSFFFFFFSSLPSPLSPFLLQGENQLITEMDIFPTMRSLLLQSGGEKGTQEYMKAAWVLFDVIMTKVVKDQVCSVVSLRLSSLHPASHLSPSALPDGGERGARRDERICRGAHLRDPLWPAGENGQRACSRGLLFFLFLLR